MYEPLNQIRSHQACADAEDAPSGQAQAIPASTSRRPRLGRVIATGLLFGIIAAFFIINLDRFSEHSTGLIVDVNQAKASKSYVDFDVFHLVAQMTWRGEIEQAYSFATMGAAQEAIAGKKTFMPWTYPPQFNLVVAPLAFMPLGLAYGLFTGSTMIAYLFILRAISGGYFVRVAIILLPAITVTMACGQNGFLTGSLIGLTCLGMQRGRSLAGLSLGLMVIKPHLALAFALHTFAARQWSTALVAAMTVVSTSLLVTVLLGPGIWLTFLGGVKEAAGFLEEGLYPLFRMISPYAALRTLGLSATLASAGQILFAILSLGIVVLTQFRGFNARQTLGLTAVASLLISPYAYDYDLPIYGIGVALLMADIRRSGTVVEGVAFSSLSFLVGFFGLAQTQLEISVATNSANGATLPVTLAGLALIVLLGLAWRIIARSKAGVTVDSGHPGGLCKTMFLLRG